MEVRGGADSTRGGGGRLSKLDNGDGDVCGVVKEDLLKKKN